MRATAAPPVLGLLWLVVLAVAMSAVSLYYYLQVLKQIYVAEPAEPRLAPIPVSGQLLVVLLALAVLVLGCAPGLLLDHLQTGISLAGLPQP